MMFCLQFIYYIYQSLLSQKYQFLSNQQTHDIQTPNNFSPKTIQRLPQIKVDFTSRFITPYHKQIAGTKLLMLEYAVRIPINLIIERRTLWEYQIPQNGGITAFEVNTIDANFHQIVIFLSPTADNLKKLRDLILVNVEKNPNRKFYPVFWPKRTMASKQFLENANLMQYIDVKDFSFDLLPLDVDLYSLEMKIIRELYIEDNHSIYSIVAQSIHRLQSVFGRIHNFFGKGKAANSIYQILKLKEQEIKLDENFGDIESLIIFDRQSDFLTPLLKQITYEGLIDQFYDINGGITRVPPINFDDSQNNNNQQLDNILLNSQRDPFFRQIRILTINGVGSALKKIDYEFDQFVEPQIKRHVRLKSLVTEQMKTIGFHKQLLLQQRCLMDKETQIAEYFQNMIAFQVPLPKIMRSICLQNIVDKGIHREIYSRICEDIVMTFGEKHIISLTNLAKLGLFNEQGSKDNQYPFHDIKRELRLISDQQINHENPHDPSFAYGPLFTKLVEHAIRNGWRNIIRALKIIPGEIVLPQFMKQCRSHPRPAVVVFFVGGVTYSEVASIRVLSKILKKEIIVATTHMINGETMIQSLLEPPSQYT